MRRASLADFREAFDLNTLSAVEVLKAIEKPLKKNKGRVRALFRLLRSNRASRTTPS